jgi:hypothetical protein
MLSERQERVRLVKYISFLEDKHGEKVPAVCLENGPFFKKILSQEKNKKDCEFVLILYALELFDSDLISSKDEEQQGG